MTIEKTCASEQSRFWPWYLTEKPSKQAQGSILRERYLLHWHRDDQVYDSMRFFPRWNDRSTQKALNFFEEMSPLVGSIKRKQAWEQPQYNQSGSWTKIRVQEATVVPAPGQGKAKSLTYLKLTNQRRTKMNMYRLLPRIQSHYKLIFALLLLIATCNGSLDEDGGCPLLTMVPFTPFTAR